MKTLATVLVFVALLACATSRGVIHNLAGTYDLVSLGSQPIPSADIARLWIEITPQGTWQMFEEPGARFGGTRGLFAMGDTIDSCFTFNMWPETDPRARGAMEFCPQETDSLVYLNPAWVRDLNLDGPLVFKRRR